jgi:hypothetical protein
VTVTALPSGRRPAVRIVCMAGRKVVSIIRQLVRRNGPVWLWLRREVMGIAAWARRRQRFALAGVVVFVLVGLLASWAKAAAWAFAWWALTRVPRERAERRYVTFQAAATITRTPLEVAANDSTLTFSRGTKRPVRPRSRVHIRRWIAPQLHGVRLPLGTVAQRGVISYDPRWFHDAEDDTRRALFEKVIAQRLRGHRDDLGYRFAWQPAYCRVAFRVLPPLPTGKLPYCHQDLPWHRLPVGPTHGGRLVTVDLYRRPHVILSGAVGSGKTSLAMVWLAHLLRFPNVETVLIDPARLDFHWAKPHVDRYASTLPDMVDALEAVRREVERRSAVYEDHRDWRTAGLPRFAGLVLLIEELAVLVRTVEHRMGKDAANAFRDDLLLLALNSRRVNIHLITIAQQPNADVFDSTEARDQFEWSVLCANPSKEHKTLLSSHGLALPDWNTPGRVAVIEGQRELTLAHAFWLASPTTPGTSPADRAEALRWLPGEDAVKRPTAVVTAITREHVAGQQMATEVTGQPQPDASDSDRSVSGQADSAPVIPMVRPRRRRRSQ